MAKERRQFRQVELFFILMIFLNLINVIYDVSLIVLTQYRVAEAGAAYDIMNSLHRLPQHPGLKVLVAFTCFFIVIFCIVAKGGCPKDMVYSFYFFNIIEILAGITLMWETNMSSNGIIFLIMAELLTYTSEKDNQLLFVIAAFILYLICNYHMVALYVPINSMDIWLSFYGGRWKDIFSLLGALLEGTNILLFVTFVLYMLVENRAENQRVTRLNEELQLANAQLLSFAQQQELVGETRERNRLAREIHDTIGHQLTGISVGVEAASVLIDVAPDMAKQQLERVHEAAKVGLEDVRRSVRKLQPDALDRLGLDYAIHKLISDTSQITDTNITFFNSAKEIEFEKDEEETIFRIIQESCTNAIRHGRAKNIWIQMKIQNDQLLLMIRDNGQGAPDFTEGFGLTHMRERVNLLKGDIRFSGKQGFRVIVTLPIRNRREL